MVRQLIKAGEIQSTGKPAHEYVSREELDAACAAGFTELRRRLFQEPAEIFEESIAYLHRNNLELADRASLRLAARETSVGVHALPYQTALLLARGDLDEIDYRLEFIRKTEVVDRGQLFNNLYKLLIGMTFVSVSAKAIAERVLGSIEEAKSPNHRQYFSNLSELQQLAMFITTVVCDALAKRWLKRQLREEHLYELRRVIIDAVYSSLYAHDSYGRLASSKLFVDSMISLIPRFSEPPNLLGGLVRDDEIRKD